jgi:mono/diheme cytochrome c family protein
MKRSRRPNAPDHLTPLTGRFWLIGCLLASHIFGATPSPPPSNEPGAASFHSEVTKGWILINELGCYQCHNGKPLILNELPAFDAPRLERARFRLKRAYINEWLEHPHAEQPGTRMPSLLHGIPAPQLSEITQALTDFLWQPTHLHREQETDPSGNAIEGEERFKSLGCVACHALLDDTESDKHSLRHVNKKYVTSGLFSFLRNPQETRPSFRMPNFHLSTKEALDLTSYLMTNTLRSQSLLSDSSDSIESGRQWFQQLQCGQCHTLGENMKVAVPNQSNLSECRLDSGCLAEAPQSGVPWYALNPGQRQQIRKALNHSTPSENSIPTLGVEAYMETLRCDACHARGTLVGPDEAQRDYFTTTGDDLEDEGRFPPHLNGVGRKMKLEALLKTIQGSLPARPYMNTRMPDFGESHAHFLANSFARIDADPSEQSTPRNGQENQVGRNMWGRALAGINGLGCIQCHPLNGNRSLGIQAMDLKHAAERLRAPWFRDYLLDPSAFRPGTRMPAFWPNGNPSINGHGGSAERQIDSIWAYLNELDQSRLPEGMEQKDDFKLIPQDKPIVFRTFMQQAGLHAIAVGFPESFHVAFDAKKCQWSLAWKGDFLSAESTWDDRFTPLASPLGRKRAWFPDTKGVWAVGDNNDFMLKHQNLFRGYQLDAEGIPTFIYQVGKSITIQDRIHAEQHGITRQLQWPSDEAGLQLLISSNSSYEELTDECFRITDSLDIEIIQGIPEWRTSSNQSELWLKPVQEDGFHRMGYRMKEPGS